MSDIKLICGNWGTSSLRAFGMSTDGEIVTNVRTAPGIAALSKFEQEALWFDTVGDWGDAPHLICGMAGSNLGWLQTDYVQTPAKADTIANAIVWQRYNGIEIGIVPGLSAEGWMGQAERMRGEETELIGWLARFGQNSATVCLPGTHTKWVDIDKGAIGSFTTALTGELFALLKTASILKTETPQIQSISAFEMGAQLGLSETCPDTLHGLFAARSGVLSDRIAPHQTEAFLSGFLIARDISGALKPLKSDQKTIHLIGAEKLTNRFAHVLTLAGLESHHASSELCVAAGFLALASAGGNI
ncbi:MAG: 2-dehydro-3-deoxygalactonokinase [Pseudomonadota bacterium]